MKFYDQSNANEHGYPLVLDEYETIKAVIRGNKSLARFGDGELKIAKGKSAKSQASNDQMRIEFVDILKNNNPNCLVGIPNICNHKMSRRKEEFWRQYRVKTYSSMYDKNKIYYSSFITRPDASEHINHPEYWELCKNMWHNKDVVLLQGEKTNFDKTGTLFLNARTFIGIRGPERDAYEHIDELMKEIYVAIEGYSNPIVILALGPTATAMAYRMSSKVQTIDMGHFGMFYAKHGVWNADQ